MSYINKAIAATQKNPRYDLKCAELNEIIAEAMQTRSVNSIYDAVTTAFNYGYVKGHRAAIAEQKQR